MTINLAEAKVGKCYNIIKVKGEKPIKKRLMDMGLIPGTRIFVQKFAPLGDPIEITVRGTEITLRKIDAVNITIETIIEK